MTQLMVPSRQCSMQALQECVFCSHWCSVLHVRQVKPADSTVQELRLL